MSRDTQIIEQAVMMLEVEPELEITSAVRQAANDYGIDYDTPEMAKTVARLIKQIVG
jgi:hypothetical protein